MLFPHLLILITFVTIQQCSATCRVSYYTVCEDLNDLKTLQNIESITELVIGDEDSNNELYDFDMNTIEYDAFEKLTSLVIVHQIKDAKTYTFSLDPLTSKLQNLFLYKNTLRRLREGVFDNVKLIKLSLVGNEIEYIHKEVFYTCDIQIIDFSENKLEAIEKHVFEDEYLGNSTKELILKHNKISRIEPKSLPLSLEILNLDYNELSHLEYSVFSYLENLKELTLSHNKLTNPPTLSTLTQIEVLDFSFNKMINVNGKDFDNLKYLEIVDFSNNLIATACILKFFGPAPRKPPLQISLAFNRLTYLDNTNFTSFKDHILFLYGNPWNCRCWNQMETLMVAEKFKRNSCDLEFFNKGVTPYCISFSENNSSLCEGCKWEKKTPYAKEDLDRFVDLIEKNKKDVKCSLKLRRL